MRTIDTTVIQAVRPVAVILIVAALAVTFGVIAAPRAETDATGGGIFARMGDYLTEAGEALGSE
ncbi:MAG TPA: hypothetical protein VEH00_07610 [Steroidobacteraceae bacterium]|nr:hypothetical protein [Steroidobacteraceae bacterium]